MSAHKKTRLSPGGTVCFCQPFLPGFVASPFGELSFSSRGPHPDLKKVDGVEAWFERSARFGESSL
jgi:hypothetical protein